MKVAVTARGPGPEFEVDESFGRSYWFLICDLETGSWEAIDNAATRNALEDAGLQASLLLADLGIDCVVTGQTGPKAFRSLSSAGIQIYHGAIGTVGESLRAWQSGKLEKATAARCSGSPYCLVAKSSPVQARAVRPGYLKFAKTY